MHILFYKQQKDWSCGPASLRMALAAIGVYYTEQNIAKQFNINSKRGTKNKSFPLFAEQHKLNYLVSRNSTLQNIHNALKQEYIIIINYFDPKEKEGHYAVIKKLTPKKIYLLDPWHGPHHNISIKTFLLLWKSGFEKEKKWFFAIKKIHK